jgi:hypothetical protein
MVSPLNRRDPRQSVPLSTLILSTESDTLCEQKYMKKSIIILVAKTLIRWNFKGKVAFNESISVSVESFLKKMNITPQVEQAFLPRSSRRAGEEE